jgi:hypothetical protein
MTSPVDICNQALGWLGAAPIVSLDDNSRTAELCKINYQPLTEAVLEARCWTFAEMRSTSTTQDQPGDTGPGKDPEDGYPEWGSGFVHTIPDDYLMVFRVYKDVTSKPLIDAEWVRHNQYIIADRDTVFMWGVRKETDPNKYTVTFVQALAARIASDLCLPITQNQKLQADMWTLYESKLREAASRDGAQGRSEDIMANRLINARRR